MKNKANFEVVSPYKPAGDQPKAIETLSNSILDGNRYQTLEGVTGSGKTHTMARVIEKVKNNTGHFTHQSLPNSELFIGIDFSNNSRINEIIATHESYILFPSDDALNLTYENPKSGSKPLAIFLIDSTWACTKKIFTQSTNLQKLKHMSFTTRL